MSKMKYKHSKSYMGNMSVLPTSKNFSELGVVLGDDDDKSGLDLGDSGEQDEQILSQIQANYLLIKILFSLDDRRKIILLYQILRETGYEISYEECSKTLSITRQKYLVLLKEVRRKARKVLSQEQEL